MYFIRFIFMIILVFLSLSVNSYSQSTYIPVTSLGLEGTPLSISNSQIRYLVGEGMRIYFDTENVGEKTINSFKLWLLIYYEKNDNPDLIEFNSNDILPPGEIRNIYLDESDKNSAPISGLIVPAYVEMEDITFWRLRDYYDISNAGFTGSSKQFTFPQVGEVTIIDKNLGVLNNGSLYGLHDGQRLGIIREAEGNIEKIAHIRLLKTLPTRSGFNVDYLYPDKEILISDRIQVLSPGITRLNTTVKSLVFMSGVSAAVGGVFHYLRDSDLDKEKDEIIPIKKMEYARRAEDNNKRREAAFVTAGITFSSAILSEILWGQKGKHLHPPEFSLHPSYWNTTTRTFLTIGTAAIGTGAFYDKQQKNARDLLCDTVSPFTIADCNEDYRKYKQYRDVSYLVGGTAIVAGALNQLFLSNSWTISKPEAEYVLRKRNQVSKSLLIWGSTALGTAAYYTYKKSQDNEKRKQAATVEEADDYAIKMAVDRRYRDTALILAGGTILSSAFAQFLHYNNPGDEFFDTAMFGLPKMHKFSWFLTGLSAAGAVSGLFFNESMELNQTKYNEALDETSASFYRDRLETYENRRKISYITSGVSLGCAVISHYILRGRIPDRISYNNNNNESVIEPHFDPINSSIGLRIKF
ncbi:hypothetical protein ACFL7D_03615 [candidate division KSB1 bacterium]